MPNDVLDRLARDPDLQAAVGEGLAKDLGGAVIYQGGGATWTGAERVYSMRVQIVGPVAGTGLTGAALMPAAIPLLPLSLVLLSVALVLSAHINRQTVVEVREIFELLTPEERRELFQAINWIARAAAFAAVAVTVGVGAYVLQRTGVVA